MVGFGTSTQGASKVRVKRRQTGGCRGMCNESCSCPGPLDRRRSGNCAASWRRSRSIRLAGGAVGGGADAGAAAGDGRGTVVGQLGLPVTVVPDFVMRYV